MLLTPPIYVTGKQKLIIILYFLFIYFFDQAKLLSFNAWVTEDSVGLPAKRVNMPTSTAEPSRCAASSPT